MYSENVADLLFYCSKLKSIGIPENVLGYSLQIDDRRQLL